MPANPTPLVRDGIIRDCKSHIGWLAGVGNTWQDIALRLEIQTVYRHYLFFLHCCVEQFFRLKSRHLS